MISVLLSILLSALATPCGGERAQILHFYFNFQYLFFVSILAPLHHLHFLPGNSLVLVEVIIDSILSDIGNYCANFNLPYAHLRIKYAL